MGILQKDARSYFWLYIMITLKQYLILLTREMAFHTAYKALMKILNA